MAATVFGVTPQGFRRKTLEDIVGEMEADEHATVADDLDVSSEALAGQFNGIFGRQLSIGWEQLETCYNGFDPDAAEDRLLETISKLTGTFRRGLTASEVVLTCDIDSGTVLGNGVAFAALIDQADIRWTPKVDYTAATSGAQPVTFVSEVLGPVVGLAGLISVIATPIVGWKSCLNADDAELGLQVDTDPVLRARRESDLASRGSATARAVESKVAQAFADQLENLTVFENEEDVTDTNGVPPHSLEVLVFDGEVPSIDNDALAQVIFDNKAGGIRAYGNSTGNATALVNGVPQVKTVGFSRAEQLDIYLIIHVAKLATYAGDSALAISVAAAANKQFGPGNSVIRSVIESFAVKVAGVYDVTDVFLGLAPGPVSSSNIPVSIRQIPRFESARITVVSTLHIGP